MTSMMKTKLQEQLADPTFYNGLRECLKADEALAYFAQHGLELEEIEALKTWNTAMEDANRTGQLADEELDQVAGGKKRVCLYNTSLYGGCREWGYINEYA